MRSISRLAELAQDWRYLIQRDGCGAALPVVWGQLVQLPYQHNEFVVVARSLLEPVPDLRPKIALQIREFEPADLDLVRRMDIPSQVKLCAQRLARGHRGFLALHDGQPAGYAWGCAEFAPTLERVHWELKPGDMLCVDVYTAPAFRGKGVHTALTLARCRLFRELGYRRAIAYIETSNYPSLAVWQKLGCQVVGHIDYRRTGPWRRASYT